PTDDVFSGGESLEPLPFLPLSNTISCRREWSVALTNRSNLLRSVSNRTSHSLHFPYSYHLYKILSINYINYLTIQTHCQAKSFHNKKPLADNVCYGKRLSVISFNR